MRNRKIGVFDSGFGGLSILREVVKKLPDYSYIYLGDTARAPYGNRSQNIVYDFTEQAVDFLFKQDCGFVILACNTASAEALRKIQREHLPKHYPNRRVLGVIIPAAEQAVEVSESGRVGVLATDSTVASGAFERELKKLKAGVEVFQVACSLFVPIVEAGEHKSEIADIAIKNYVGPLLEKDIDTLILGCTHYSLLKDKIKETIGYNVRIISEGEIVAQKLEEYLKRHPEIESTLAKEQKIKFLTTDLTDRFRLLGSKFFGKEITPEKVNTLAKT